MNLVRTKASASTALACSAVSALLALPVPYVMSVRANLKFCLWPTAHTKIYIGSSHSLFIEFSIYIVYTACNLISKMEDV